MDWRKNYYQYAQNHAYNLHHQQQTTKQQQALLHQSPIHDCHHKKEQIMKKNVTVNAASNLPPLGSISNFANDAACNPLNQHQETLVPSSAQYESYGKTQEKVQVRVIPKIPGNLVEVGHEHSGRWTKREHDSFLEALKIHGKDFKMIAAKVKTRTIVQTKRHAKTYFRQLQNATEQLGDTKKSVNIKNNISFEAQKAPSYTSLAHKGHQLMTRATMLSIAPKQKEATPAITKDNPLSTVNFTSNPSFSLNATSTLLHQQYAPTTSQLIQSRTTALNENRPAQLIQGNPHHKIHRHMAQKQLQMQHAFISCRDFSKKFEALPSLAPSAAASTGTTYLAGTKQISHLSIDTCGNSNPFQKIDPTPEVGSRKSDDSSLKTCGKRNQTEITAAMILAGVTTSSVPEHGFRTAKRAHNFMGYNRQNESITAVKSMQREQCKSASKGTIITQSVGQSQEFHHPTPGQIFLQQSPLIYGSATPIASQKSQIRTTDVTTSQRNQQAASASFKDVHLWKEHQKRMFQIDANQHPKNSFYSYPSAMPQGQRLPHGFAVASVPTARNGMLSPSRSHSTSYDNRMVQYSLNQAMLGQPRKLNTPTWTAKGCQSVNSVSGTTFNQYPVPAWNKKTLIPNFAKSQTPTFSYIHNNKAPLHFALQNIKPRTYPCSNPLFRDQHGKNIPYEEDLDVYRYFFDPDEGTYAADFMRKIDSNNFTHWLIERKKTWKNLYNWNCQKRKKIRIECEEIVIFPYAGNSDCMSQYKQWLRVRKNQWRMQSRKRQRLMMENKNKDGTNCNGLDSSDTKNMSINKTVTSSAQLIIPKLNSDSLTSRHHRNTTSGIMLHIDTLLEEEEKRHKMLKERPPIDISFIFDAKCGAPDDIIVCIMNYLHYSEHAKLLCISKSTGDAFKNRDHVWRQLCPRRWILPRRPRKPWYELYQSKLKTEVEVSRKRLDDLIGKISNILFKGDHLMKIEKLVNHAEKNLFFNVNYCSAVVCERNSVLNLAVIHQRHKVARWLVETKGANIETSDRGEFSPLINAAWAGNKYLVRFFLQKGANRMKVGTGHYTQALAPPDFQGHTAEEWARKKGHDEIAELIRIGI